MPSIQNGTATTEMPLPSRRARSSSGRFFVSVLEHPRRVNRFVKSHSGPIFAPWIRLIVSGMDAIYGGTGTKSGRLFASNTGLVAYGWLGGIELSGMPLGPNAREFPAWQVRGSGDRTARSNRQDLFYRVPRGFGWESGIRCRAGRCWHIIRRQSGTHFAETALRGGSGLELKCRILWWGRSQRVARGRQPQMVLWSEPQRNGNSNT
jgi:hypothetical protein